MSGYTKLFSSILASTVWDLPPATCKVWITMMAMADQHGDVQASVPGLALMARVSRVECETALGAFIAPDPDSRTSEDEGRRIEKIDGGWRLINHQKYMLKMSIEDKRERERERKRAQRVSQMSHFVRDVPVVPVCPTNSATRLDETILDETKQDQITDLAPRPSERSAEPAVLTFPVDGEGENWVLSTTQLAAWAALFPSLDLLAECRAALAWTLANPSRRKTSRGMATFLVNWFSRSQNKGGGNRQSLPQDGRCEWHRNGNRSKPAFRPCVTCPECKHLKHYKAARQSEPASTAELLAAQERFAAAIRAEKGVGT